MRKIRREQLQVIMEFVHSSDDFCAGYLEDDSDLEFSECSEGASSDEGEGGIRRCRGSRVRGSGICGEDWSEDEFERDMESELMGLLQAVASPDALAAARTSQGSGQIRSRATRRRKILPKSKPLSLATNGEGKQGGGGGGGGADETGAADDEDTREGGAREEEDDGRKEEVGGGGGGGGGEKQLDEAGAYYDKMYFETSSSEEEAEEGGGEQKQRRKRRGSSERREERQQRLTDEELFYDPHMDEEDEQWVKRQRMAYHNVKVSEKLKEEQQIRLARSRSPSQGPSQGQGGDGEDAEEEGERGGGEGLGQIPKRSDAHLSCPACMTTVCIDCQQHAHYSNQFRAMFVMNCRIVRDEVLRHVPKSTKRERQQRWKRGRRSGGGGGGEEKEKEKEKEGTEGTSQTEEYYPVHCAECNTEIAVYDREEIFHFYNVLASAAS